MIVHVVVGKVAHELTDLPVLSLMPLLNINSQLLIGL